MADLKQLFEGRIKGRVVYGSDIDKKYLNDFSAPVDEWSVKKTGEKVDCIAA